MDMMAGTEAEQTREQVQEMAKALGRKMDTAALVMVTYGVLLLLVAVCPLLWQRRNVLGSNLRESCEVVIRKKVRKTEKRDFHSPLHSPRQNSEGACEKCKYCGLGYDTPKRLEQKKSCYSCGKFVQ